MQPVTPGLCNSYSEKTSKIERKAPRMAPLFMKVARLAWPVTLLKKDAVVGVILLILYFFKNTFSTERLHVTASGI